jgi:hypothetical protein
MKRKEQLSETEIISGHMQISIVLLSFHITYFGLEW